MDTGKQSIGDRPEIRMLLGDISECGTERLYKIRGMVYLHMQLRRFNRDELKYIYEQTNKMINKRIRS